MKHTDWTLWWHDWLFQLPWWATVLALIGITPVAIWLIRGVIQGLWVNPFTHDWAAANFDIALALGAWNLFILAEDVPADASFTHGWPYVLLNYGGIAAGFGFAMFKWWQERKDVAGWRARLGATSLYHVFVLAYMVPLYAVLIFNTWSAPWNHFWLVVNHVTLFVAIIVWVVVGNTADVQHRTAPDGQSKFVYTSPEDGWRNIRRLFDWLKKQYRPSVGPSSQYWTEAENEKLPLSYKLDVLPGWRWLLGANPLLIFVTGVVLSPGIMEINDVLFVHGHFVPLSAQWLSAQFDVALWAAIAIMSAMLKRMSYYAYPDWLLLARTHLIVLFVPISFGVWHVWQEWDDIPMSARTGVNYLYHNLFLFAFLGYMLLILLVTMIYMLLRNAEAYKSVWYWLGAVVSCALIYSWVWAGDFDRTHQYAPGGTPKAAFANPADPWNGLIPQAFWWLNDLIQKGFGSATQGLALVLDWTLKQLM